MMRRHGQARSSGEAMVVRLSLYGAACALVACTASPSADSLEPLRPARVILPGRETALIDLLQPYWNAAQPPSLSGAKIERTVVRVSADSGAGQGALVLRHATEVSKPVGKLLAGGEGSLDVDIQCPSCSAPGQEALLKVAQSIIDRQHKTHAQIWSANPDKRENTSERRRMPTEWRTRALLGFVLVTTILAVILRVQRLRRKAALRRPDGPPPPPAST